MKGLLIKDIRMVMQQKRMFAILAVLFFSFLIFQGRDSALFVISYMTLMGSMMVLNNISYDEFNNSIAHYLTMPVTRKEYVVEKYLFRILCGGACWLVSSLIYIGIDIQNGMETACISLITFPVIMVLLMIMLPVQLKFGGDKGRIVLLGVVAAVLLGSIVAKMLGNYLVESSPEMSRLIYGMMDMVTYMPPWAYVVIALVIWCILLAVSLPVSVRIMEKKEF